jgi:hypothetical protein
MTRLSRQIQHEVRLTKQVRQLGRTRVTDHYWSCTCGAHCAAPTGFRYEHEARSDWLFHRRDAARGGGRS